MMYKQFIIILLMLSACSTGVDRVKMEKARTEIVQTERDFEQMAASKGLSEAFAYYADSAAALNRGGYVVHGKDSIRLIYLAPRYKGVRLEWKPDFVEVSTTCDLGYTYGKYTYTTRDSTGQTVSSKGIFHTVWKKQASGNWRFVWD
jgi:ketosteroid isomerase-like protein